MAVCTCLRFANSLLHVMAECRNDLVNEKFKQALIDNHVYHRHFQSATGVCQ